MPGTVPLSPSSFRAGIARAAPFLKDETPAPRLRSNTFGEYKGGSGKQGVGRDAQQSLKPLNNQSPNVRDSGRSID